MKNLQNQTRQSTVVLTVVNMNLKIERIRIVGKTLFHCNNSLSGNYIFLSDLFIYISIKYNIYKCIFTRY